MSAGERQWEGGGGVFFGEGGGGGDGGGGGGGGGGVGGGLAVVFSFPGLKSITVPRQLCVIQPQPD